MRIRPAILAFISFCSVCGFAQTPSDTLTDRVHRLPSVGVEGLRTPQQVVVTQPHQEMSRERMEQTGVTSVADAAKFFAGTNVRDYGGLGGMKTVSVRNLGAHHTAVSYDGITISNTQAGQIDVGRFSLDNVQTLSFSIGQTSDYMQTARHLASAGLLSIETERPVFGEGKPWALRTRVSGGSFGRFNPSFRYDQQIGSCIALLCNFICSLPADKAIPLNAITPLIGAPIIVYVIARHRE